MNIGIIASQQRFSVVVPPGDTTIPVITLTGGNLTIDEGVAYVEPGYSASDNVDGNITGNVIVSYGGLNTSNPAEGVYTITYNVSDAAGNAAAQKSRTVTVEAEVDPNPSKPNNITVGNITDTSVFIDWANSVDDVGIEGYNIFLSGGIYSNTIINGETLIPVSQYALTGLTPLTTYTFTIQSVDTDGNTAMSVVTEFTTE